MHLLLVPLLLFVAAVVFLVRKEFRRALVAGFAALLVAAVVGPGPVLPTQTARRNACIFNLRRIDEAKKAWALTNNLTNGSVPSLTDLATIDSRLRVTPECPEGGSYSVSAVGQPPACTRSNLGHMLH